MPRPRRPVRSGSGPRWLASWTVLRSRFVRCHCAPSLNRATSRGGAKNRLSRGWPPRRRPRAWRDPAAARSPPPRARADTPAASSAFARLELVRAEAVEQQPGAHAVDRVPPLVGVAQVLRHVARVVVCGVPVDAQRDRLDRLRAEPAARALDGGADRVERLDRVGAVDASRTGSTSRRRCARRCAC